MKKFLAMAFMLCACAGIQADTLCTIVASPCDEVQNKMFVGEATKEQIEKAQKELADDCDKAKAQAQKKTKELH